MEGFHCWPDAPEEYKLLRAPHGHIFRFLCIIPVTESRQLEFLAVRRRLQQVLRNSYGAEPADFRSMSCEDLAESLIRSIRNIYEVESSVQVLEDPDVGAIVHSVEEGE
jgi:hypothetical protein